MLRRSIHITAWFKSVQAAFLIKEIVGVAFYIPHSLHQRLYIYIPFNHFAEQKFGIFIGKLFICSKTTTFSCSLGVNGTISNWKSEVFSSADFRTITCWVAVHQFGRLQVTGDRKRVPEVKFLASKSSFPATGCRPQRLSFYSFGGFRLTSKTPQQAGLKKYCNTKYALRILYWK